MGGTTMTYEEFLEQQGYYFRGTPGGGEDAPRSGWARDAVDGDGNYYVSFLGGDDEEREQRGYNEALAASRPPPPPPPPPPPQPSCEDPNQVYVLGGMIPMRRPPPPPPTPEVPNPPAPEPVIDWDAWKQITANYEAAKDQDGGSIFSQVTNALDDAVNDAIPGGWATVAAVAVAIGTGYVDPTLFATEAGTTALATEGAATLTAAELATLTEASALVDPIMAGAGGTNWAAVGQSALTGAGKGVASNVLTSALTGREITPEGLAISAITGGAGGGAGNLASQYDFGSIGSGAVSGGVGSTTGALLTGGDIGTSLARGALSGGIGGASSSLVSDLDPATKAGVQSVASGLTNAAITGNTTNLLPNLIAGGLGSAGTTAAWNALTSDTVPTSGTQKAEVDTLDPMTQFLADNINNPSLIDDQTYNNLADANVLLLNANEPIPTDAGGTLSPKTEDTDVEYMQNPDGSISDAKQYRALLELGTYTDAEAREASQFGSIDTEKNDFRIPTVEETAPPLNPEPASEITPSEYYEALVSKGVEPALATKMSGYSPSGEPGALPIGSSDGGGGGTTRSVFDGDGEGTRGVPGGAGILPVVTEPVLPIATDLGGLDTPVQPVLDAGELVVEGERPYVPFEEDFPLQPDEEPEVVKEPVVTKPTGDVIKGTVTSPSTTIKTTTPGALPTAATTSTPTPQASSAAAPSTSQSGGIPTPISGQSLAAAPVYGNTQILQQLKQLDPKLLSMVAPHLLNQSGPTGLSALSPQIPQQATGGNMQQSNPYNTLFQTMLADKGGTNPSYGAPMFSAASNMLGYAAGGSATMDDYLTHIKKLRDKEQTGALMSSGLKLLGAPAYNTMGFKDGGHIPEFKTGTTGHYVKGAGDGQSDDIPAMLADGEYVFDADTVASLGNGSSDAGAQLLDHFREAAREHKRSAPVDKIPPKASPLAYMKEALKRHTRG